MVAFLAWYRRGVSQTAMAGPSPAEGLACTTTQMCTLRPAGGTRPGHAAWKRGRDLDRRVLSALALDQLGQRLAGDERLEVRRLLMRREGVLVVEHFVEEEFGR